MARSGQDYRDNERGRRDTRRNKRGFNPNGYFEENEDRFIPIEKYRKPHSRLDRRLDSDDEEYERKAS